MTCKNSMPLSLKAWCAALWPAGDWRPVSYHLLQLLIAGFIVAVVIAFKYWPVVTLQIGYPDGAGWDNIYKINPDLFHHVPSLTSRSETLHQPRISRRDATF